MATERIYPTGDGATIEWNEVNTDNVGTNHYARVDDPYGTWDDASNNTLYTNAGGIDIYTMGNVAAMGGSDTATDLTAYLRINSSTGSSETMQVSYSLNGTDWTQIGTNVVLNETAYTEYTRTVGSLSLSQANVNNLQIKIQRTAGSNDIRISALSVLVTYTGGGTAHPYIGGAGVGALTRGAFTVKARGKTPTVGAAQIHAAGTVRAKGKVPTVGGTQASSAGTVRARGKAPVVGGSYAFGSSSVYINTTLFLYTSGGTQVYSSDTEKSRGKNYVGEGVLVFSNGSTRAIGRVYESNGVFLFSGGSVYTGESSVAHSYAGGGAYSFQSVTQKAKGKAYNGQGVIVFNGATVYVHTAYALPLEHLEAKPSNSWEIEGKPSDGYSLEPLPGMPGSQDGAYTDPLQDGAWTDFPEDGAYTKIGYEPEFPPPNRYTTSVESKPSNTYAREGKPS